MNSPSSKIHTSETQTPDITGLRMITDGLWITLRCLAGGHAFERYLTTIASVAIGRYECPQCHIINEVWPEDFEAALDRYLPTRSMDEIIQLTEEATRITETWYRVEPLNELLNYHGVNLGEGPERELVAFVVQGLYIATENKKRSQT